MTHERPTDADGLWRAARRTPDDVALWPPLLAAYARLGRIEEGARRLRDLLLLAPRSKERDELYLETLFQGGHGLGDPGFQPPRPFQKLASPDERHLAIASAAGGLQVHETAHGSIVLDPVELGPAFLLRWIDEERLLAVRVPDDATLVLGVASVSGPTFRMTRIDLGAPWELRELRVEPRGRWLVLLHERAATLVGLPGERVTRVENLPFAKEADLVRFAPGGDLLYLGDFKAGARGHVLLDLEGGASHTFFAADLATRWNAAWSPDGRWLALHGSQQVRAPVERNPWDDDDHGEPGLYQLTATVVDARDRSVHAVSGLGTLEEESDRTFAWLEEGLLRVGGVFWDPVARAARTPERPGDVASARDHGRGEERAAAACRELEVSVAWSTAEPLGAGNTRDENPRRRPLAHEHPLTELWISDDGRRLLTSEQGRRAWVWDLATGARLAHASGERLIGLTRDGRSWFTVGSSYTIAPIGERRPLTVEAPPLGTVHHASYDLMDVSPDGRRVVVRGWPRDLELFETGSASPLARNEKIPSASRCLRFTKDGRHVAILAFAVGATPRVLLLDATTLAEVASWAVAKVPYSFPDPTLVELPSGSGFAVVGGGEVLVCRLGEKDARPLVSGRGATGALAVSPDGLELALATERGLELCDLAAATPLLRGTIATPFRAYAILYTPDGRALLFTQACHVRMARRAT